MHMVPTQRAGEMGPWWTLGIKVVLIIVIPWGTWVTVQTIKNQAFRNDGERFTNDDGHDMEARLTERITTHGTQGGHMVMEARMAMTEKNQDKILENQIEILVAVGKMQQQLDNMKESP